MLSDVQKTKIAELHNEGYSSRYIAEAVLGRKSRKSTVNDYLTKWRKELPEDDSPNILFIDIETAPMRAAVWQLWDQNVGLNQIENDWYILSFCAKWQGSDEVIYEDLRGYVHDEDDHGLLLSIWKLFDQADIVIGHNLKRFDNKKINARFFEHGFPPPSHYKQVDTLTMAKSKFAFTSNKLEYLTDKFCTQYKKLQHSKFAGYTLWAECLKDNKEAWDEMRDYNINDVLSLEELYDKLKAWDTSHPNVSVYTGKHTCTCGSEDLIEDGYYYTNTAKYQKYKCGDCGASYRDRVNLISKNKLQVRI